MRWANEKVFSVIISTRVTGFRMCRMELEFRLGWMNGETASSFATDTRDTGSMAKDMVNYQHQGFGIFYYANGTTYHGYWINNLKHGNAFFINELGQTLNSLFIKDKLSKSTLVNSYFFHHI